MSRRYSGQHGNRQIVSMLLLRQEGRCFYCKKEIWIHAEQDYHRKATLDHKTPLAFGGEPFGNNVVAACRLCNGHKGHLDAPTFISVRDDHQRRRELLTEAHARIDAMTQDERDANRRRIKRDSKESMIRLQIALQPVILAYRQRQAGVAER